MRYVPDLAQMRGEPCFYVGYLSSQHPFATGVVAAELVERLAAFSRHPAQITFGFHRCELCGNAVGSSDFLVATEDGRFYMAPDMITHYVADHQYLPPSEFIQAVFETPLWQGEPLAASEQALRIVTQTKYARGHISARNFALRTKLPTIFAHPQWLDAQADLLLDDLITNALFNDSEAQQMVALLKDPAYNLSAAPVILPDALKPAPGMHATLGISSRY